MDFGGGWKNLSLNSAKIAIFIWLAEIIGPIFVRNKRMEKQNVDLVKEMNDLPARKDHLEMNEEEEWG